MHILLPRPVDRDKYLCLVAAACSFACQYTPAVYDGTVWRLGLGLDSYRCIRTASGGDQNIEREQRRY